MGTMRLVSNDRLEPRKVIELRMVRPPAPLPPPPGAPGSNAGKRLGSCSSAEESTLDLGADFVIAQLAEGGAMTGDHVDGLRAFRRPTDRCG